MKQLALTFLLLISTSLFNVQAAQPPVIDFENLKKAHWSDEELANAELITDFVQSIMNNHDFEYVMRTFNNSAYKQHNRNIPDTMKGLVGFLREFVSDYPEYSYDVKRISVDNNMVIFHSHATLNSEDRGDDSKGLNIVDIWRIEDGNIVEHWDSVQALDGFMRFYSLISGGDINNSNGVF